MHSDTNHQHIHCIASRIGYDGLAAPTNHSKRKIAALCRSLEQDFNLQKVLSPKVFLPKAQRNLPRKDSRKAAIKSAITHALWDCRSMESFIQKMEAGGYRVIKGRGISFMDDKKVQVKGSELGYSLAKIERILKVKQEVVIGQGLQEKVEKGLLLDKEKEVEEQQGAGLLATLTDGVGKDYVTGQPQKKRRKKRRLGW